MNESITFAEVRNVTADASILFIDSGGGEEERYAEVIFAFIYNE